MNIRPLYVIANEIRADWKKVSIPARPYLDAMSNLEKITDHFGFDDAKSIVLYFLCNASGWKGDKAKAIKKELKGMCK